MNDSYKHPKICPSEPPHSVPTLSTPYVDYPYHMQHYPHGDIHSLDTKTQHSPFNNVGHLHVLLIRSWKSDPLY